MNTILQVTALTSVGHSTQCPSKPRDLFSQPWCGGRAIETPLLPGTSTYTQRNATAPGCAAVFTDIDCRRQNHQDKTRPSYQYQSYLPNKRNTSADEQASQARLRISLPCSFFCGGLVLSASRPEINANVGRLLVIGARGYIIYHERAQKGRLLTALYSKILLRTASSAMFAPRLSRLHEGSTDKSEFLFLPGAERTLCSACPMCPTPPRG